MAYYLLTFAESEEETYEGEGKDILEKCDIESFSLSKFNQIIGHIMSQLPCSTVLHGNCSIMCVVWIGYQGKYLRKF